MNNEVCAKKDRPWRRRRRKSCDFQSYHHRRQKELKNTIVISTIDVNPLPQKKIKKAPTKVSMQPIISRD
jgi:hypothetical protein